MAQGFTIVAIGLVAGGGAALATGRVLRGMLVGVGPADPVTFAGAFLVMAAVAAAASYLPALRASGVDPMAAIRQD
jgi:ABC-type antimicrobial peptide transport system permease subunit